MIEILKLGFSYLQPSMRRYQECQVAQACRPLLTDPVDLTTLGLL